MDKREINDLVAEKVMGYVQTKFKGQEGWGTPDQHTWFSHFNPSGDISNAWIVVEYLRREKDYWFELTTDEPFSLNYKCYFQLDDMEETAISETAPMSICLAALRTVGIYIN